MGGAPQGQHRAERLDEVVLAIARQGFIESRVAVGRGDSGEVLTRASDLAAVPFSDDEILGALHRHYERVLLARTERAAPGNASVLIRQWYGGTSR